MGRPLLAAALLALLAACSDPCRELGNELCRCAPAGTTRDTCERQVKQELDRVNPDDDQDAFCDGKLATCKAPAGADFCQWLDTACGKAQCGLSNDDPQLACE
jgi:hypothetical protein